jgi:hypothetical protein
VAQLLEEQTRDEPATTTGRPYSEQTKSYGRVPITVET